MRKDVKGFTIINLLIYLIFFILIVIGIFNLYKDKIIESNFKKCKKIHMNNIKNLKQHANRYILNEKEVKKEDITDKLVSKGYIKEIPKNPLYSKENIRYKVIIGENQKIIVE